MASSKKLSRGEVVKVAGALGYFTVRVVDVNYQAGTFYADNGRTYKLGDILL